MTADGWGRCAAERATTPARVRARPIRPFPAHPTTSPTPSVIARVIAYGWSCRPMRAEGRALRAFLLAFGRAVEADPRSLTGLEVQVGV